MKKSIMIIEDDIETQMLFAELLHSEGYEVFPMSNGMEAVCALETGVKPDLIFMDLNFPQGSPEEFTTKLRSKIELSQTPIILLSGKDDIAEYARLLRASSFVKKPFEIEPVLELIQTYIS